jgi:Integrase core domain.
MLFIPDCHVCLVSISQLLKTLPHETVTITSKGLTLSGSKVTGTTPIFAPINKSSGLPISLGHRFNSSNLNDSKSPEVDLMSLQILNSTIAAVDPRNLNLSESEKELLRCHQRLGHVAFSKVQHLMRSGVLSNSEATRHLHTSCCKIKSSLKCAACQFAKQRANSTPGRSTSVIRDRQGVLRSGNLLPGQEVSVDHFTCSAKGRLFTSRGKSADKDMFTGGCIFVDNASGYVNVQIQSILTSHATLSSKIAYENHCRDHGVIPQKYLSDNGLSFTSKQFVDHLTSFHQHHHLAGVGAHHHNGHAERAIQTIISISRAMIIHSAIHWPELVDTSLWPMAVSHAVFLWNHLVYLLVSALLIYLPDQVGSTPSSMIFMFGVVPLMFWIKPLQMGRRYLVGSLDPLINSI